MKQVAAYYNEFDPKAAEWLRELIKAGLIANGYVDTRSILDVKPADLAGFTQCHFFAGLGGWSRALRLAHWPDHRPIWTGSAPCQPFSAAGRQLGTADERHLWPAFFDLIKVCRPAVVAGEQVASGAALAWLDIVSADLEGAGYAFGAADLCAAGVGAPHIRQRIYWVGDANGAEREQLERFWAGPGEADCAGPSGQLDGSSAAGGVEHPVGDGSQGWLRRWSQERRSELLSGAAGSDGAVGDSAVADAGGERRQQVAGGASGDEATHGGERRDGSAADGNHLAASDGKDGGGFWSACDWIPCRDGKARPVEPGTFPLAHGVPNRVGLLRGYGNAIVPQVAQAFIEAYLTVAP